MYVTSTHPSLVSISTVPRGRRPAVAATWIVACGSEAPLEPAAIVVCAGETIIDREISVPVPPVQPVNRQL